MTDKYTVVRLLEVICIRRVVHIGRNFIDARQRVQDFHVFLAACKHGFVQDAAVFHSFVFHGVCKTFPLNPCHIDDVRKRNDIREFGVLVVFQFVVFDRLFIADLFTPVFNARGIVPGRDIFGAILEDDWTGTHCEWTVWENRRPELGALAVRYLVALLSGEDMIPGEVRLPVIEKQSTHGF